MAKTETQFDVIVVGAGMMGAAAARHLAQQGASVALVGPSEPQQTKSHTGVFASHYDQARITRKLDSNVDWSRLAAASIARYAQIEQSGNQAFFHPVGSLMAGPENGDGSDFIRKTLEVGEDEEIDFEAFRGEKLRDRFPCFDFPAGILALYEASEAGWINPRQHVAAQIACARQLGADVIRAEAEEITEHGEHVTVRCADGTQITGSKAIVACGAFSKATGLLPDPVQMTVYARTITFFELDEAEADRLKDMPSVVYIPPDLSCDPYILPPVRYPDGKVYIKIGGDTDDAALETMQDVKDWFRGGGSETAGEFLADKLTTLMPDLRFQSISFGSCVTSFTETKKPLIYPQSERLFALTGGNGAGAKCSDELGRLGAALALGKDLASSDYEATFTP